MASYEILTSSIPKQPEVIERLMSEKQFAVELKAIQMKNLHLHIRGRVQGVGFRYSAKLLARNLGLSGFVVNMPDESVYIEVEGKDDTLDQFVHWCYSGPERAVVENVKIEQGPVRNYSGFETRFS